FGKICLRFCLSFVRAERAGSRPRAGGHHTDRGGAATNRTPRLQLQVHPVMMRCMSGRTSPPKPGAKPPTRTLRLHGTIARKLGISIVSGRYRPGDLLGGEIASSEQFAVSRTAYREAGRIRAATGL